MMPPMSAEKHTGKQVGPRGDMSSDLLLFFASAIWGFAFVAQRIGMSHVGPFTFNAIRFALGALALVPFLVVLNGRNGKQGKQGGRDKLPTCVGYKSILLPILAVGLLLFIGASLQQVGVVYTTAGKAGFITGLYVIFVPLLGLFWRQRTERLVWLAAMMAVAGMYLLSVTESNSISKGDLLVLISALFWAGHVLAIGWYSKRLVPLKLAIGQFAVCSGLSLIVALLYEEIAWSGVRAAAIPILYAGLLSVSVAYTLQVFAQRKAHPAHAAIILSLESVFAALGGWFVLGETLSLRALIGCALMLVGMLLSQLGQIRGNRGRHRQG
jgi:drug/metabolite transporter (DMT)-like permease